MLRLPCNGITEQSVTNTIFAAAFAALGMRVKAHRAHDLKSGQDGAAFTVSSVSETNPALQTSVLHWALINNSLHRSDPLHPLLDAVATLRNRAAILRWIKRAEPQHLVPDGRRMIYAPGAHHGHLIAPGIPTVHTDDLHIAAALGRIGVPLVRFTGVSPRHHFHFPPLGLTLPCGYQCDVRTTLAALQNGTLETEEPAHPLHISLLACREYDNLKRCLSETCTMLTLHDTKYGSKRQATLREDAIPAAYDTSRSWFAKKK